MPSIDFREAEEKGGKKGGGGRGGGERDHFNLGSILGQNFWMNKYDETKFRIKYQHFTDLQLAAGKPKKKK